MGRSEGGEGGREGVREREGERNERERERGGGASRVLGM